MSANVGQILPYSKKAWGFNPLRAGQCVLWLDASDTSTVIGTNPVTQWRDKSTSLTSGTISTAVAQRIDGTTPVLVQYTLAASLVIANVGIFIVGASVTVTNLTGGTNLNVTGGTIVGVTASTFTVFVNGAAGTSTTATQGTATVGATSLLLANAVNAGNAQTVTYNCTNNFAVFEQVTITGNSSGALNLAAQTVLAGVSSTRFSVINGGPTAGTTGTGGTATTARHATGSGNSTYLTTAPSGLNSITTGTGGFFTTTNPAYTNVTLHDFSLFVAAKHVSSGGLKYIVSKNTGSTTPRFFMSANTNTPTFQYATAPAGAGIAARLTHTIDGSALTSGNWHIFSGSAYRPNRHTLVSTITGPARISGTTDFAINGTAATQVSMPLYSNVAIGGATNASGTTAVFTTSGNHGFGNGSGGGTDVINTTGFTPAAYNLTSAAITVTGLTTFTATLGSSGNIINTVAGVAGYATPTLTAAGTSLVIGGITSNFWNSDIGEVLMYMGPMDATTRQQIEGYLAKKWGVTVAGTHTSIPPYLTPFINPVSGQFPGVTTCITWYDAADPTTLVNGSDIPVPDGGTVITWKNKITGGPNITTWGTGGTSPAFRNATTNAVTFAFGTNKGGIAASALTFSTASTFTIFSVVRLDFIPSTVIGCYVIAIFGDNGLNTTSILESRVATTGAAPCILYIDAQPGTMPGTASYLSFNATSADLSGDKGWVVVCHQRSGVNGQMLNTINGNIGPVSTLVYDAGLTTVRFTLGNSSAVPSGRISVGEFIVFNSALTNTARQSVEGYLMTKWGVKNTTLPLTSPNVSFGPGLSALNIPPSHPNFVGSATTVANINGTS